MKWSFANILNFQKDSLYGMSGIDCNIRILKLLRFIYFKPSRLSDKHNLILKYFYKIKKIRYDKRI